MIEVNIALISDTPRARPTYEINTIIESIQCESYTIGDGGITFYRMRFIAGANNPNEYFASFFFPTHMIAWMQCRFTSYTKLPDYNQELAE